MLIATNFVISSKTSLQMKKISTKPDDPLCSIASMLGMIVGNQTTMIATQAKQQKQIDAIMNGRINAPALSPQPSAADTSERSNTIVDLTVDATPLFTPPAKRKAQVQPNIMHGFGITHTEVNKSGVRSTLSPAIVDISPIGQKCTYCSKQCCNAGNLTQHLLSCEAKLNFDAPENPEKRLKIDGRINNSGSAKRDNRQNKKKFRAILLYDSFAGDGSVGNFISKEMGVPVPTVNKWIQTPATRAQIRLNFLRDPFGLRNGKKSKKSGECRQGEFHAAEKELFSIIGVRRARGRRVSPQFVSRTMVRLVKEMYANDPNKSERAARFKAIPRWRVRFYNRFNLVTRFYEDWCSAVSQIRSIPAM